MNWLIFGVAFLALFFFLVILLWKEIRFYWKFYAYFCVGFLCVILLLPVALRYPGRIENLTLVGRVIAYCLACIGVEYELRGAEHLSMEEGAMWVANHQQMIDSLGCFNCITVAKRVSIIMKRELMYHPAGLAAKLYGVVFLDRNNSNTSQNDVNKWAHDAREQKYKVWIHPEGTRHFEAFKTQCLLPFKKGAFHAAVAAQIPILITTLSPYYFINHDERVFGRGKVIMEVLPPISTEGMTKEDVPELLARVRNIMTERYRVLSDEVLSSLPPSHPVFQWLNHVK